MIKEQVVTLGVSVWEKVGREQRSWKLLKSFRVSDSQHFQMTYLLSSHPNLFAEIRHIGYWMSIYSDLVVGSLDEETLN